MSDYDSKILLRLDLNQDDVNALYCISRRVAGHPVRSYRSVFDKIELLLNKYASITKDKTSNIVVVLSCIRTVLKVIFMNNDIIVSLGLTQKDIDALWSMSNFISGYRNGESYRTYTEELHTKLSHYKSKGIVNMVTGDIHFKKFNIYLILK